MSYGGDPGPDSFSLDRVGRARPGNGVGTVLERRDGDGWNTVDRYPDRVAASRALDVIVAGGGSPTDHRLVTEERRGVQRFLLIGAAVLAIILLVSLWQIIR
jgi:hypothetical protein